MHRTIAAVVFAGALLATGCSSDGASPKPTTPAVTTVPETASAGCGSPAVAGESQETLTSGGMERWYFRALPPGYDPATPSPVVLDFHGYGEGAELHQQMSNLTGLGAEQGFIVITPHGLGEPPQWATELDSPDLDFVGDLLDEIEADLCVDTNRVFSTGYSNGARLTSAIACRYGDRIAATSTVAGVREIDDCEFSRPVPMVAFHGTADDVVPYQGGLGEGNLDAPAPDGSDRTWRETLTDDEIAALQAAERPTPEIVAAWAERNGCSTDTTERDEAADVEMTNWDCPPDGTTELFTVADGGHTWPGSDLSAQLAPALGATTMSIDANEIMWEFFQNHPMPADAREIPASTGSDAIGRGPDGEWATSAPSEHGIDVELLEQAKSYAFADGRNTQSVLIVRGGEIVAEWFAPGADADSWAASWSAAKSFVGALIGIAIDEGLIPGVDEPMTTYYPEWAGTPREGITLLDVLQMQSGLDWVETYDPSTTNESDIIQQVLNEGDQLAYAAGQPMKTTPGTEFNYSGGDALLLSGVIEQVAGMSAGEYAEAKLLEPIGIDGAEWWSDTFGHTLSYCCIDATTRDFARFGQLYLDRGKWGDRQVVPEQWVIDSTTASAASEGKYGYQLWLDEEAPIPADMFHASGHDAQRIFVIPSLDLVVVRNGIYTKYDGPAVADPNLLTLYPSDGRVPGKGTLVPGDWDDTDFLTLVLEAIDT